MEEGEEALTAMVNAGSVLKSRQFVFGVGVDSTVRKIFQVVFGKSDGSIFVTLPYFEHSTGIVSNVTFPSGPAAGTIELRDEGKVTSHRVKYSHHPDGAVHFSQHGKIKASVRRRGVPLETMYGHLFTVHAEGLASFERASEKDGISAPPNPRRTLLTFNYEKVRPVGVKFVGRLYSVEALLRDTSQGKIEPKMPLLDPETGKVVPAFVCTPPDGWPGSDRCLLVSCEEQPRRYIGGDSSLMFLGGFDDGEIVRDPTRPTSFLALSYPLENAEDLRRLLGSVDL